VTNRVAALIGRARTEIDVVRVLSSAGYDGQATSRAYYATFYAASAALAVLGETRSKHSGVIAAFGRLVIKDGGFDADVGGTLRRLFERRNEFDDDTLDATDDAGDDPAPGAERFVDAVEAWIEQRS
jgi:uncharacterized protein (UPF0332 family)